MRVSSLAVVAFVALLCGFFVPQVQATSSELLLALQKDNVVMFQACGNSLCPSSPASVGAPSCNCGASNPPASCGCVQKRPYADSVTGPLPLEPMRPTECAPSIAGATPGNCQVAPQAATCKSTDSFCRENDGNSWSCPLENPNCAETQKLRPSKTASCRCVNEAPAPCGCSQLPRCVKGGVKANIVDGLITCKRGKGDFRAVTLQKATPASTQYNLGTTQPPLEAFRPQVVRIDPKTKLPFCPRGTVAPPLVQGKPSCALRRQRARAGGRRRFRRSTAAPLQPNSACQCMNQCQQQCPCRTNSSTCAGLNEAQQRALMDEVKRVNGEIERQMQLLGKESKSTGQSAKEDMLHRQIAAKLLKEENDLKTEKALITDTLGKSKQVAAKERDFALQSIRNLRSDFVRTSQLAKNRAEKLRRLRAAADAARKSTKRGSGYDERMNLARRSFCRRQCAVGKAGLHCRQAQQAYGCICFRKCPPGPTGASCRILQAESLCICRKKCKSQACIAAQKAAECILPGEALAIKDEVCYQRCPACKRSLAASASAMAGCMIRKTACVQAKVRANCFVKRVCQRKCLARRPGKRCRYMKKLAQCYKYVGGPKPAKKGKERLSKENRQILSSLKQCAQKCEVGDRGANCRAIRLGACRSVRSSIAHIAKHVDFRADVKYRTNDISQYWWKNRHRNETALVGKNRQLFQTTTGINRSTAKKFKELHRMERLLMSSSRKLFGKRFTNLRSLMVFLSQQLR